MISILSLRRVTTGAVVLAFFVVMLGAYTRLTDAGLGCPDWPGCYGHLVLPSSLPEVTQAQTLYPHTPIESGKAWTEMAHRYAAGTLAFLILIVAFTSVALRKKRVRLPLFLPGLLLLLVLFQATLGMWTVTLKLLPVVVMGHLLGGILIFACLCCFRFQLSSVRGGFPSTIRPWIGAGVLIVFCQIALGGWVSSNYAGIACIGFPRCNGQWLPHGAFREAFHLFSSIGTNYQGGVLDNEARMIIQMVHRLGAYVTAAYVALLSGFIVARVRIKSLQVLAAVALLLVTIQMTLGVINVLYLLPLWAAVAHNGVAALLLATMLCQYDLASRRLVYARV